MQNLTDSHCCTSTILRTRSDSKSTADYPRSGVRLMPTRFVFICHSHHLKDVEGNPRCFLLRIVPEKFYRRGRLLCDME